MNGALISNKRGVLVTDKRTEIFSIRIPEVTAAMLGHLSSVERARLNDDILRTIAWHIHTSRKHFDPSMYLSSQENDEGST